MNYEAVTVVELDGVTKRFGSVTAVDGISFHVARGQIISLLGPSGCGKTTTLRIIAGFEAPDSGRVVLSNRDVVGLRPYERNVGLLFQDYALFPHMTVEQNVVYGMKRRRFSREQVRERLAAMLSLVQLTGMEKRYPLTLSGGQQQRVALARALATGPELMLLDEPLSALDAKLRQELQVELKEILSSVGTTAIVVTHDQEEAMSLTERVIVMDRGRIMQEGTPTDVYARPKNRFVAEFIGRSNWFSGSFEEEVDCNLWRFRDRSGLSLAVFCAQPHVGVHEICVRPERIAIAAIEEQNEAAAINLLPAYVVNSVHIGQDVRVTVDTLTGLRLMAIERFSNTNPYRPGTKVFLRFRAEDCVVIPRAAGPP